MNTEPQTLLLGLLKFRERETAISPRPHSCSLGMVEGRSCPVCVFSAEKNFVEEEKNESHTQTSKNEGDGLGRHYSRLAGQSRPNTESFSSEIQSLLSLLYSCSVRT